MITLIVGRPRTGKTYYLVVLLLDRLQRAFSSRPVVSNVRGHVGVKHSIDFQDDFTDRKYDKSLIVLDEVQFYSVRDKTGSMFQHFTVHGHQERDYVWITQSTSALPAKWLGLVERTIKIETVAGSYISRALHYVGTPIRGDEPIETETYKPRQTDLYKTVEDGMTPPKRKMPSKVIMLAFFALFFAVAAPAGGYFMVNRFLDKTTVLSAVPVASDPLTVSNVSASSISPSSSASSFVLPSGSKLYKYDDVGDDGYNVTPRLVRYPLSVSQAIALFGGSTDIFRSCGGLSVSDKRITRCSDRVTTLEESRKDHLVSVLPPKFYARN